MPNAEKSGKESPHSEERKMRVPSGKLIPKLIPQSGTLLALVVLLAGVASAQTKNPPPQPTGAAAMASAQTSEAQDNKADHSAGQSAAKDRAISSQEARQAQLVADTNKLFELAQELQAEVAKSGKNVLSIAVVKKAAEVEKLAKSLKERMRSE